MITRDTKYCLRSYPSYKPSRVPWLGEVPVHWKVWPTRAVFTEINERGYPDEQLLSVTISEGVIRQQALLQDSSQKDSSQLDKSDYKLVRPGDIVYNKMRAWQGATGVSRYRGIVSPAYIVQRPRTGANPLYFHRLLRTPAFTTEAARWSYGIASDMWSLRPEHFKVIRTCVPPQPEQVAIVRYLDYMDRRIRRYVRAKRKLIALLEEERQAVISQAVTRGLDLNVRLKSSGVEWLGDVPAHWEVLQVGHFSKVGNGSTPSRGNTAYWSNGTHPWLNSSSVNQATITRADQFVTDLALHECHLPRVRSGSVLVGITGQGKTRGMSAVLSMDATINQHMAYITPTTARVSSNYLQMCLTAAYSELRAVSGASGSTKAALTCQDIKRFRVVLPPRDEQDRLLSEVSRELAGVDGTIARARRQIELVQEYRTRLIADVVTGKLDVREAAAQLAEEADDPDPLDDGFPLTDGTDDDNYDAEEEAAEKPTMESEVTI